MCPQQNGGKLVKVPCFDERDPRCGSALGADEVLCSRTPLLAVVVTPGEMTPGLLQ